MENYNDEGDHQGGQSRQFVIPDFTTQSERLEIQLRSSLKLYYGLSYHPENWELDLFFLLAYFQKIFYY